MPTQSTDSAQHLHVAMLMMLAIALFTSGWQPYDRLTWLLEVTPVLVAVPVLWLSYKRFPLTPLLYWCIFIHALLLILGGAYTYARVPLGYALQEWLELSRNPYDKIGHFFQGFVPALIAREVLLRKQLINHKGMMTFLVLCVVLAISACYELIEWSAALILGQGAEEFLGTQGDQWDTQSDIFLALVGGVLALVFFTGWQDRQIQALQQ